MKTHWKGVKWQHHLRRVPLCWVTGQLPLVLSLLLMEYFLDALYFYSTLILFCVLASLTLFLCVSPHILPLVTCPTVQSLYASWGLPRAHALARQFSPMFPIVPLHRLRPNTKAWIWTQWSLTYPFLFTCCYDDFLSDDAAIIFHIAVTLHLGESLSAQ